ncbi:beta-ketoacyl synthase N-terminal-like domain-containing protein [Jidongwangia harbinensis]|uniref:beta-ketoacyl synthase N-terminal-like domain-containing protein n=1 Tax=Jidongwangia harbinensis TaxID=2878561 RepID=UPI001CD98C1B|nr:beta-ketoacyl synthase N-terminal-like domain-containing protein [Jidongwangia harbinensis]MCA2218257.1 hypothetical protein [Jidongwangia harbinensis]
MTGPGRPAAVTGIGLAVSGLGTPDDLLQPDGAEEAFDPATGLTGRAMRHKDRASRFALRAAADALRDAGLLTGATFAGPASRTCVVVSTNFGNLDSVCTFADTIAEDSVLGLSPLGLPHTSSNSVAGWLAIEYGLRGPNLTVCNGGTGGLDALFWARAMIAADRADVALVVGVEPDTAPVARLVGHRPRLDGAAAVVLESVPHRRSRGAPPRAVITACTHGAALPDAVRAVRGTDRQPVGLWLTPAGPRPGDAASSWCATTRDLTARLGECSGALGVLQCVAGVSYLDASGPGAVLATSADGPDHTAVAALLLTAPGQAS